MSDPGSRQWREMSRWSRFVAVALAISFTVILLGLVVDMMRPAMTRAEAEQAAFDYMIEHGIAGYMAPIAPPEDRSRLAQSMGTLLRNRMIVVVEYAYFCTIHPDDIVVYQPARGGPMIHRALYQTPRGWVVQGDSNERADPDLLTAENFMGLYRARFLYR